MNVTEDDLLALVEELGLGEADAEELVKGLGGSTKAASSQPEESKPVAKKEEVASKAESKQAESAPVEKAEESNKTDLESVTQDSGEPSTEAKEA